MRSGEVQCRKARCYKVGSRSGRAPLGLQRLSRPSDTGPCWPRRQRRKERKSGESCAFAYAILQKRTDWRDYKVLADCRFNLTAADSRQDISRHRHRRLNSDRTRQLHRDGKRDRVGLISKRDEPNHCRVRRDRNRKVLLDLLRFCDRLRLRRAE